MRYIWIVFIAVTIAGCSTLPDADKITSFGSAVEQSGQSLETIAAENLRVALLSDQEKEAVRYVSGDDYKVLSRPAFRIAEREFAFRRTQLKALSGYGAALKQAADPKKIQDIKDASSKLASAVGTFAGTVAPGGAAIVTPVLSAAGKGAGMAISDRYARQVNALIVETDPYVQAAVKNLKIDFHTINENSRRRLDAYEKNVWRALSETRSKEVEVTGPSGEKETKLAVRDPDHLAPLYAQFIDANKRIVDATNAFEAAQKAEGALDKIAAAHSALREGAATAAPSIEDLLAFSDDLAAIASATKGN